MLGEPDDTDIRGKKLRVSNPQPNKWLVSIIDNAGESVVIGTGHHKAKARQDAREMVELMAIVLREDK